MAPAAFFAGMMVLYNSELLPADEVRLPLPNRGLYFNDGFFETLVWEPTGLRYLPHHMARMQRAAAALGLQLPSALSTPAALTATVRRLTCTAAEPLQRIRLQLWRAGAGLYAPATAEVQWLMTTQPFQPNNSPITTCGFAETVRTYRSPVSFCKGPNALTYVLAAREREQRGLEELILLSVDGYVAETVTAAIFWLRGTTLYSAAEATGRVQGVQVGHLRRIAETIGINWQEGLFTPTDLLAADAICTANVAGIRLVKQIGSQRFPSEHSVLQQLFAAATLRA